MGCWNENIFGGDNALDWRDNIYEFCKVEQFDSNNEFISIPIGVIKEKAVEIMDMIDSVEEEDDRNIGYLVLAAIMMHSGSHFSEPIKDKIISAIDTDSWSKTNQVRKVVMINYKNLISEYSPGVSVNVENVNLLENKDASEEDMLSEEFKQIYGILVARTKKLKKSIEEKSGVKDYDDGFKDAAEEEIDFLTEFKDLFEKYEQFASLQEKIDEGMKTGFSASAGTTVGNKQSSGGSGGSSNDVMAG